MIRTALLALSILAAAAPFAQTPTVTLSSNVMPIKKIPVKGNCETFNDYRENQGVKDGDGVSHPRYAGWTTVQFNYSYTTRYTTRTERGRVRLSATVSVKFTGNADTYRLDWVPTSPLSPACLKEKRRWEATVEAHEYRHVRDFQEQLKTAGAAFKKGWTLEVWGASKAEAEAELDRRVKSVLDGELDRLLKENDRLEEAFHRTPQGGLIIDINCGVCSEQG